MASVTAFRLANWDTPFWVNPNRRASRYGPPGSVVQYWCLNPLGCWAEQLRFHGVREPEHAAELRLRPWVSTVELPESTLHLTFDNAAGHGVDPEALVADDWRPCQAWIANRDGLEALIAPSAALPGTENLIMFGPRLRSRWGCPPLDPSLYVPSDPVADVAEVVADLVPHVRWHGTEHAGYEAWRAGEAPPQPPVVNVDRRS